jgi:hypothetical protein
MFNVKHNQDQGCTNNKRTGDEQMKKERCTLEQAMEVSSTPVLEQMKVKGRGHKFLLELAEHYRQLYLARCEANKELEEWG